jgi:flagellar biosynthesis/type III secretory pathway M-ring protein FliF/YscJ
MKRLMQKACLVFAGLLVAAVFLRPVLQAQETAPPAATPPAAQPSPPPESEKEGTEPELSADEEISADNNLSFPVDI